MSPDQENEIIRREFKHRGKRNACQLLSDIQEKLRRPSGWTPRLCSIAHRAEKMNLKIQW
jgi:hypothetical protein